MSLPPRLAARLPEDGRVNTKLTHEHVVETMYGADRPFFSLQQLQERIKPDVSKVTLRNRLDDLEERDIVATESFADSLTLYYIDHPASEWPVSPEGKRALAGEDSGTDAPLRELLQHPRVRLILRQELLRSIAWAALGLVGWAILISGSDRLPATVWTVLGLPVLTWASLTLGLVGIRLLTDTDLQVKSREGLHVIALGGVVLGGFWAGFLIFVLGWPPLAVGAVSVAVTIVSLVGYTRLVLPRFDATDGG